MTGRRPGAVQAYLALTAHLVPVVQALLLSGAQGVPGHNEVTEGDVHFAVPLGFPWERQDHLLQGKLRALFPPTSRIWTLLRHVEI